MTHIQGRRNQEGAPINFKEAVALTSAMALLGLAAINYFSPPDLSPPPQAIVRSVSDVAPELVSVEPINDIDRLDQLAMGTVMLSSPEQLQAIADAYKQAKEMDNEKLRSDVEVIINTYEKMGWVFSNDTVFTVLPATADLPDWMKEQKKLPEGLNYRVLAAQVQGSFVGVGHLGCAIDNTPGDEEMINPFESSQKQRPLDIALGCPFPQLNTATN